MIKLLVNFHHCKLVLCVLVLLFLILQFLAHESNDHYVFISELFCGILQSTALPLELLKAAVLFRISLTTEPHETRVADITALTTFAAVCRHWWKMMKTSSIPSRRQLKQMFRSKICCILICYFISCSLLLHCRLTAVDSDN